MATVGGRVILFGGEGALGLLDDTWQFDGTDWTQLAPAVHPPARTGYSMTALGDRAVLFGGETSDTWEWNGTTWIDKHPTPSPSPRRAPALAARGARAVLFGGVSEIGQSLGDTWEWDGTTWTELRPPVSPMSSAPVATTLAGEMLIFGGSDFGGTTSFWAWNGVTWRRLVAPVVPSRRYRHCLAELGGQVLLVGGELSERPQFAQDQWTFDGTTWSQVGGAGPTSSILTSNRFAALGTSVVAVDLERGHLQTWLYEDGGWTKLVQTVTPPVGNLVGWVDRVVVPQTPGQSGRETWSMRRTAWRLDSVEAPDAAFPIAYSVVGTRLFGIGRGVWEFDGNQWLLRSTDQAPELFGGAFIGTPDAAIFWGSSFDFDAGFREHRETWEWSGSAWSKRSDVAAPIGSRGFMIGGEVFAYGGAGSDAGSTNEVNRWTGSTWAPFEVEGEAPPAHPVRPLEDPQLVTVGDEVFLFDGAIWKLTKITTGPPLPPPATSRCEVTPDLIWLAAGLTAVARRRRHGSRIDSHAAGSIRSCRSLARPVER